MLLVEEVRRGLYHLRLEKYIYSVEFKTSESGRKKVKKELVNHTFDLLGGGPLFQHSFTLSFQLTPKQPSSREQETLLHYYTDITNIELSMNVRQGTTSNPLVNRPIKILPVFVWAALDGNQADELFKMSETRWWRFNLHTKGKFNPLRLGLYIDYGGFPPSTSRGILDGKRTTLAHLAELFNSQSLCDVTFHLSDHEKETHVGAHRAILIARSPVFARMFEQAGMTEAQTGQVTVQDIRPAVFRQLLHYLYSGEAPKLEDDDVTIPLFIAADRYGVEDLKEECAQLLIARLKTDNAVHSLVLAHLHSAPGLYAASLGFVVRYISLISNLQDWKDLFKNYPDLFYSVVQRVIARLPKEEDQ